MADIGTDYRSAKNCIAAAFDEAVDVRITGHRFAEALLARLAALDPPMVVVALDPPIDAASESGDIGGLPSPQRATWAGMTGARFSDESAPGSGAGYQSQGQVAGELPPAPPSEGTLTATPAGAPDVGSTDAGPDIDDSTRASLERGMAQAAAGQLVSLGDFSQYADEVTVVGRRSAITLWHVINELADAETGVDGNVIRGWLDTTVREAVLGAAAENIPTIGDRVQFIADSSYAGRWGRVVASYRHTPAGHTVDVELEGGPIILTAARSVRVERENDAQPTDD